MTTLKIFPETESKEVWTERDFFAAKEKLAHSRQYAKIFWLKQTQPFLLEMKCSETSLADGST